MARFDSVDLGTNLSRLVRQARGKLLEMLVSLVEDGTLRPEMTVADVIRFLLEGDSQ